MLRAAEQLQTIYHIDKTIRETGTIVDDGLHEIFVNTVVDDGTDIADLMSCFTKKQVKNPKFPALSREVTRLKEDEGGVESVCETMKKYEDQARAEGLAEGEAARKRLVEEVTRLRAQLEAIGMKPA